MKIFFLILNYKNKFYFDELFQDKINIFISDNGSTDGTELLCLNLVNQSHRIRYFKHETNLGFSANLMNVLNEGQGKYLWMLGDDEIIDVNALEIILATLTKERPSWLLCNFNKIYDSKSHLEKFKQFNLNSDLVGMSLDKVLSIIGVWSSFMSINIISQQSFRDWLKKDLISNSDYIGFDICLHAGALGKIYVLNTPLITRKVFPLENHRFDKIETYTLNFFTPLDRLVKDKNLTYFTRNKLSTEMFLSVAIPMLLKARLNDSYIPIVNKLIARHWKYASFWLLIFPIVIFPKPIFIVCFHVLEKLLLCFNLPKLQKLHSYLLH